MLVVPVASALAGCGGSPHKPSTSGSIPAPAATTTTAPPTELKTIRCPKPVALPGGSDYAGPATVFIVGSSPRPSGCGLAGGWVVSWVKAGAVSGGYAAGRYVGFRCDGGFTVAATGPLGSKSSHYSGAIHCAQVDHTAAGGVAPQLQLSSTKAGIWAYYGAIAPPPPPPSGPALSAAGSLDPAKLKAALARQLSTLARVKATSLSCPPLARARGARVTCKFAGTDVDNSRAVTGSADLTVQDAAGHRVGWTYQFTEGAGGSRGTGYDFDPVTGKTS